MVETMTPAIQRALWRARHEQKNGRLISSEMLTRDDDMMIERLIERGELTWVRADLWKLTPKGVAAARAAKDPAND